jgi:hypothetical protein
VGEHHRLTVRATRDHDVEPTDDAHPGRLPQPFAWRII